MGHVPQGLRGAATGHASASANFEFYLAVYFLWTVFYRRCFASGDNVEALVAASRSGCTTFMRDVGEGLALLWIIFNVRKRLVCQSYSVKSLGAFFACPPLLERGV